MSSSSAVSEQALDRAKVIAFNSGWSIRTIAGTTVAQNSVDELVACFVAGLESTGDSRKRTASEIPQDEGKSKRPR